MCLFIHFLWQASGIDKEQARTSWNHLEQAETTWNYLERLEKTLNKVQPAEKNGTSKVPFIGSYCACSNIAQWNTILPTAMWQRLPS